MYHINFCQIYFLVINVCCPWIITYCSLQKVFSIRIFNTIHINIACMQSSIFSFLSKLFIIRLNLSLQNTTNCNNISWNATINQIIFNFTLNSLRHLACINIINIRLNFLNFEPLIKASDSRMLFRAKNSAPAIRIYTPVWGFPSSIYQAY
jgi:hypothetical protein